MEVLFFYAFEHHLSDESNMLVKCSNNAVRGTISCYTVNNSGLIVLFYLVAYDDKNDIEVLRHEIIMDIAFADDFGFFG